MEKKTKFDIDVSSIMSKIKLELDCIEKSLKKEGCK
jgi:hypothetical protein